MAAATLVLPVPQLLGLWTVPLWADYEVHKLLHVLGAVLFLGNIATGALWGILAVRAQDPATLRFTLSTINWTDAAFTGPGLLVLLWNGLAMAGHRGGVQAEAFTVWGLGLLYAVVLAWILCIVPDQHRILARAGDAATMPRPLRMAILRWNVIGGAAGAVAFGILGIMVLR